MQTDKLVHAQQKLYNGKTKDIDKNLKALIKAQKEAILARKIDDELER